MGRGGKRRGGRKKGGKGGGREGGGGAKISNFFRHFEVEVGEKVFLAEFLVCLIIMVKQSRMLLGSLEIDLVLKFFDFE